MINNYPMDIVLIDPALLLLSCISICGLKMESNLEKKSMEVDEGDGFLYEEEKNMEGKSIQDFSC